MKTKGIIISVIGIFFCFNLYSDLISVDLHNLMHCVKITNISDYKEISLVGNVKEVGGGEYSYIINDSTCLTKGYRFNTLFIYAASNDYLAAKNIDEIVWAGNENASVANVNIEPSSEYVENSNPLSAHEEYYKIMGFTEVTMVLHKWKEVFKFNNGAPDSVLTYNYTDNSKPLYQNFLLVPKPINLDVLKIFIYPNPSKDYLDIQIKTNHSGNINFSLYDMNGKTISTSLIRLPSDNYTIQLPVSNIPKGTYFIKFIYENLIDIQRVIIE